MSDKWEKVDMAPTWDYTTQKEIEGLFVGREENVGPNGSNMYTVEVKGRGNVGIWGNAVLDVRFKNLSIGEEIKVVYLGKVKSEKTKREYHNFDVYHRPMPMEKVSNQEDIESVEPDEVPF